MGYPRECPRCAAPHVPPYEGTATLSRRFDGAGDPHLQDRPGPILLLRCRACDARYWWDFFAAAVRRPRRARGES